jgi:transcriptional regulator with XRE-family HTH domain
LKFAKTLFMLRSRAGLTRYRLALEASTDPGHVGRLERGERRHPSRDLVLRLGQALLDNSGDITLQDVDQLLQAAGHGPLPRNRISSIPTGRTTWDRVRRWLPQRAIRLSQSPRLPV